MYGRFLFEGSDHHFLQVHYPANTPFSTPLFSQTCAPRHPQPLSFEMLPENTGDRVPCRRASIPLFRLLTFNSQLIPLTPFLLTLTRISSFHAKSTTVSSLTATLTDTPSRKSFACHSYRKRGWKGGMPGCLSPGIQNAVGSTFPGFSNSARQQLNV